MSKMKLRNLDYLFDSNLYSGLHCLSLTQVDTESCCTIGQHNILLSCILFDDQMVTSHDSVWGVVIC